MSAWQRHFRAAAKATEPRPGAIERLQRRAALPGTLLRQAGIEPRPGALERLRARQRRPVARFRPVLALPAVAFAAVLLFFWLRPPPPLSAELLSSTETTRALTPHVALSYTGAGGVRGDAQAPRIRWEAGSLRVEVEPKQGIDLAVQTDEALVKVVGTAFRVTRDALGTTVSVERGHVEVRCGEGSPQQLLAGDRTECTPLRAAGWIGRVQAMMRAGQAPEVLLAAIDQGLALARPDDPAVGELVALKIRVLMGASRYPEAMAAAEAYLASGAVPRREEVSALLESLRARP
jgi:ferric-dicitrate binding protein FerR (iron transport regulator)